MSSIEEIMIQAYFDAGEQLKKGNPKGFSIIRNCLNSLVYIIDNEEIIFQQAAIGTTSDAFIENEAKMEGGRKFLSDVGDILSQIGEANKRKDYNAINQLLRKFTKAMNDRWKLSVRIYKNAEKK